MNSLKSRLAAIQKNRAALDRQIAHLSNACSAPEISVRAGELSDVFSNATAEQFDHALGLLQSLSRLEHPSSFSDAIDGEATMIDEHNQQQG